MPSEPPTARLIRLLETAPRMPLMRDHVRLDCIEVLKLVDTIAGPATASGKRAAAETAGDADRPADLEAVRQAVLRARPIPFTDQVRLPAIEVVDLADRLRRREASWTIRA
jgi:hypothetical protein